MNDTHRNGFSDGLSSHLLFSIPLSERGEQIEGSLCLDNRHQGWMQLPHGGVLMSCLLQAAHQGFGELFASRGDGQAVRTSFRWGGPTLFLGEEIVISARRDPAGVEGSIRKKGEDRPTLTARIEPGPPKLSLKDLDPIPDIVEGLAKDGADSTIPLPYSQNCFVCGSARAVPGLERRFYCLENRDERIVFTLAGVDPEDDARFFWFRLSEDEVHPGALAAVLDETLGWSGFVAARQGGVTVRLEIDFFRPVDPGERLLFFGSCTRIRGSGPHRLFWYAAGGVLPFGAGADPAPIALAKGQWLAVPKLTEEMKNHLAPSEWVSRWFSSP